VGGRVYILVTYDVGDERKRRKIRSLLRRYSLAMLAYSVYLGRGNRGIAERLAARISRLLDPGDRAALVLLQDFQYELLMDIRFERVSVRGEDYRVVVFYGRRPARDPNVGSGRSGRVRGEGKAAGGAGVGRGNAEHGGGQEDPQDAG
jgi:CRISPR-associated endonuclease Cas2